MQPWAFGKRGAPSLTSKGWFTAYHWLADENPLDKTKVFQIEKDDEITVLVWESIVPSPVTMDLSYLKEAQTTLVNSGHYDLRCAITERQGNWGMGRFTVSRAADLLGLTAAIVAIAAGLI